MMGKTTGFNRITLDNLQLLKGFELLCRMAKSKDSCKPNSWFMGLDGIDPVRVFPIFFLNFSVNHKKIHNQKIVLKVIEIMWIFLSHLFPSQAIKPSILQHVPAGISLKQIVHFAQMIRSGKFQKYDHGWTNWIHYGRLTPPSFDLQQITTNIKIYFSTKDKTTTYKDVLKLKKLLPNVQETYALSAFSHTDFIYSDRAADLVYKKVITDLMQVDQ